MINSNAKKIKSASSCVHPFFSILLHLTFVMYLIYYCYIVIYDSYDLFFESYVVSCESYDLICASYGVNFESYVLLCESYGVSYESYVLLYRPYSDKIIMRSFVGLISFFDSGCTD